MQSHVVRAPLARIMGLVPLLMELKENSPEKDEALQYLALSANELDEVIKSITYKSHSASYQTSAK